MSAFRQGTLALATAAALAASGSIACSSDIKDEGGTGTGGSGGAGAECQPTDEICYGNRPPNSPGSECLANIDNTNAKRVQIRQTWIRVVNPPGNTTPTVYSILKTRSQLDLPQCYQTGEGGYMQLTDWDRSNPDITQQTMRTGYANYQRQPLPEPPVADLIQNGMCMIEWDYNFSAPITLDPVPASDLTRWQDTSIAEADRAMPQPWHVAPVTLSRVADDFDIQTLRGTIAPGGGQFFVDETSGDMHTYTPLAWVTVLDNRSTGIAIPIREVEVRAKFNDNTFNCNGRFRADKMQLAQDCDSPADQDNPPWGCKDDSACPPSGVSDRTGPGLGPSYTRGYFLIIDLEQVWSTTLSATLCVTYPGEQASRDAGWWKPLSETGGWGKNCRGSPLWDPTLPDDAGLPMGDWCSKTNQAATSTCHDAFLSESFSTGQAFKIKDGTCGLE